MTINKRTKTVIIGVAIFILVCVIGFIVKFNKNTISSVDDKNVEDSELYVMSKGGNGTYLDGLTRYGYMDENGQIIIEPKYKKVSEFYKGVAYVQDINDKGYLMDKNENKICEVEGTTPLLLSGLWLVDIDNKLGYLDNKGQWIIKPKFNLVYAYTEELAAVKLKERWGYTDKNGAMAIECKFEDAEPFSEQLAPVKLNGKWGYINKYGAWVIEPTFQEAKQFSEELAAVKINEKWGYIDKNGVWVIEPTFHEADKFINTFAIVSQYDLNHDLNMGIINKEGKFVIEAKYDEMYNYLFDKKLFVYKQNGLYGVINNIGESVIKPIYTLSFCASGNMIFMDEDTIYFFDDNLDIKNEYKVGKVFPLSYESRLIRLMTKEGSLYFDHDGNLITKIDDDYSKAFEKMDGLN